MNDISAGRACGLCHNGRAAFPATVGTCQRCHLAPTPPAAAGG
jgi:c(7)-type cytochrome triheme protein